MSAPTRSPVARAPGRGGDGEPGRSGRWSGRRWRVGILVVAVLVATAVVTAVVRAGAPATPSVAGPVTRSGEGFVVDGRPFRFVGFNLFDAAATASYQCASWQRYSDDELTEAFRRMHDDAGATVVRFWAYQPYTDGGTRWDGVDRVLRAARATGMRVLPVLEDGPGYCTTGPAGQAKSQVDGDTWYTDGYRRPYGDARLSMRDYVRVVTEHYRGDPTILGWSLMNEAETTHRDAAGGSALIDFTRDLTAVAHTADPTHLVTLGTQSNGAPGASGPDFTAVYGLPGVDFVDVHDWGTRGSDTDPLPGSPDGVSLPSPDSATCGSRSAPIACSMALAGQVVDKPWVVGEAGIAADDAASRARRADLLGAKMDAAFANGASGYLVWQWNKVLDTEHFDVLPGTGDPLLERMAGIARQLSTPPPSASAAPVARGPTTSG